MRKHSCLIFTLVAWSIFNFGRVFSQEIIPLDEKIEFLETDVSLLKKIKISGYGQFESQWAESAGIKSFSGGDFDAGQNIRFAVRRFQLKTTYQNSLSHTVLQLSYSERGIVLKDAYLSFTEPWLQTFSMKAGLFDRPFGFEISYSSSLRESPERSRFTQSVFPGEQDLGFMLTIQPPKTHSLNFLKLESGLFNGCNTKPDFDNNKDFIGHLSLSKPLMNERMKIGGGFSYYHGAMANQSSAYYTWKDSGFVKNITDTLSPLKRQYFGFDGQFTVETPLGLTTVYGEYIWGTQVGTHSSNKTPIETVVKDKIDATNKNYIIRGYIGDSYIRNFSGGYVYFIQSVFQTGIKLVVKYDWLDPNTNVAGLDIGIFNKTDKGADIAYHTLGLGIIYSWDANLKFTVYYDRVKNEITSLKGYTLDIKDNVLTLRAQYKF